MIKAIRKSVKMPDIEEERQLLKQAQAGDLFARNSLIERHMPFILTYSWQYFKSRRINHIEYDDLLQACILGMIHAIGKFDINKSRGRFMGYAKYWLKHYMGREKHYSKSFRVPLTVMLLHDKGQLNSKIQKHVNNFREMVPLEDNFDTEGHSVSPDEYLQKKEEIAIFREAITSLPSQSVKLLRMKYMEGLSQRDISKRMGVTQEIIRQLLQKLESDLIQKCSVN